MEGLYFESDKEWLLLRYMEYPSAANPQSLKQDKVSFKFPNYHL